MKNSFFSFLFFGFFLATLISFADPQDNSKKSNKRGNRPMQSDTSASRRIEHSPNVPKMDKTDSLPMPKPAPVPSVPRPDTMRGIMK